MVIRNVSSTCIICLITVVGILSSCNDENDSVSVKENIPVIESYLFPGDTLKVKITNYIAVEDITNETLDIESLDVYIIHNDIEYLLTYLGNNIYLDTAFIINIVEGDYYELFILYGESEISAITYIQPKPQYAELSASSIAVPQFDPGSGSPPDFPDPVELIWDNADNSYYLVITECVESDPELINDNDDLPEMSFLSEPITTNYVVLRHMQFNYYGNHNVILYHLNADYAYLYEDIDNTSLNLQEVNSSITNAYGIFTGINSDTLQLNVVD